MFGALLARSADVCWRFLSRSLQKRFRRIPIARYLQPLPDSALKLDFESRTFSLDGLQLDIPAINERLQESKLTLLNCSIESVKWCLPWNLIVHKARIDIAYNCLLDEESLHTHSPPRPSSPNEYTPSTKRIHSSPPPPPSEDSDLHSNSHSPSSSQATPAQHSTAVFQLTEVLSNVLHSAVQNSAVNISDLTAIIHLPAPAPLLVLHIPTIFASFTNAERTICTTFDSVTLKSATKDSRGALVSFEDELRINIDLGDTNQPPAIDVNCPAVYVGVEANELRSIVEGLKANSQSPTTPSSTSLRATSDDSASVSAQITPSANGGDGEKPHTESMGWLRRFLNKVTGATLNPLAPSTVDEETVIHDYLELHSICERQNFLPESFPASDDCLGTEEREILENLVRSTDEVKEYMLKELGRPDDTDATTLTALIQQKINAVRRHRTTDELRDAIGDLVQCTLSQFRCSLHLVALDCQYLTVESEGDQCEINRILSLRLDQVDVGANAEEAIYLRTRSALLKSVLATRHLNQPVTAQQTVLLDVSETELSPYALRVSVGIKETTDDEKLCLYVCSRLNPTTLIMNHNVVKAWLSHLHTLRPTPKLNTKPCSDSSTELEGHTHHAGPLITSSDFQQALMDQCAPHVTFGFHGECTCDGLTLISEVEQDGPCLSWTGKCFSARCGQEFNFDLNCSFTCELTTASDTSGTGGTSVRFLSCHGEVPTTPGLSFGYGAPFALPSDLVSQDENSRLTGDSSVGGTDAQFSIDQVSLDERPISTASGPGSRDCPMYRLAIGVVEITLDQATATIIRTHTESLLEFAKEPSEPTAPIQPKLHSTETLFSAASEDSSHRTPEQSAIIPKSQHRLYNSLQDIPTASLSLRRLELRADSLISDHSYELRADLTDLNITLRHARATKAARCTVDFSVESAFSEIGDWPILRVGDKSSARLVCKPSTPSKLTADLRRVEAHAGGLIFMGGIGLHFLTKFEGVNPSGLTSCVPPKQSYDIDVDLDLAIVDCSLVLNEDIVFDKLLTELQCLGILLTESQASQSLPFSISTLKILRGRLTSVNRTLTRCKLDVGWFFNAPVEATPEDDPQCLDQLCTLLSVKGLDLKSFEDKGSIECQAVRFSLSPEVMMRLQTLGSCRLPALADARLTDGRSFRDFLLEFRQSKPTEETPFASPATLPDPPEAVSEDAQWQEDMYFRELVSHLGPHAPWQSSSGGSDQAGVSYLVPRPKPKSVIQKFKFSCNNLSADLYANPHSEAPFACASVDQLAVAQLDDGKGEEHWSFSCSDFRVEDRTNESKYENVLQGLNGPAAIIFDLRTLPVTLAPNSDGLVDVNTYTVLPGSGSSLGSVEAPPTSVEHSIDLNLPSMWLTLDMRLASRFDEFASTLHRLRERKEESDRAPNFTSSFDAKTEDYSTLHQSGNSFSDDSESEIDHPLSDLPSGFVIQSRPSVPPPEPLVLIRSFICNGLNVRVDFCPRPIGGREFTEGGPLAALNLLAHLCTVEGLELPFRQLKLEGLMTPRELVARIVGASIADFSPGQLIKYAMRGTPLLRSVWDISAAAREFFRETVEGSPNRRSGPEELIALRRLSEIFDPNATEVEVPTPRSSAECLEDGLTAFGDEEFVDAEARDRNQLETLMDTTSRLLVWAENQATSTVRVLIGPTSGRAAKRLAENSSDFVKRVAVESLKISERLVTTCSRRVSAWDGSLTRRAQAPRNTRTRSPMQRSASANAPLWSLVERGAEDFYEPGTTVDGLIDAITQLRRGWDSASSVSGDALTSAVSLQAVHAFSNLLPLLLLKPIVVVAGAASSALQGARNQLEPNRRIDRTRSLRAPKILGEGS